MLLDYQFCRKLFCSALILFLCACTPALNWRDIRWQSADGSALKAILPCKADQATRQQHMENFKVDLSMMGCVANETTFTMSRITLTSPLDAPKVLAAWQAASMRNIRPKPSGVLAIAATVSGASAWPPTGRQAIDGEVTQAHMLWFAKQTASSLTLYQAATYSKNMSDEATTTFFESIQVQ